MLLVGCIAAAWSCASAARGDDLEVVEPTETTEPAAADTPNLPDDRNWPHEPPPSAEGLWSYTEPGELPTLRDSTGALLPLVHTDVRAQLRGHFGEVDVRQSFRNDARDVIEVVYAFPLPENAAVWRMRMVVDGRVIESDIMERTVARQRYRDAKHAGQTAALLEQERPNIFTQSLANVPPGADIEVEIRYLQTLRYDAGEYEFVFPMVIGPRYLGDAGRVADAAAISPAIVGKGTQRGDALSLEVVAQTGYAIDRWTVPTHEVDHDSYHDVGAEGLRVTLREADERPNRDFVLRYRAAGPKPRATMFLGPKDDRGDGHFALVVQPPHVDVDALVGRREFIFVVDRSGSMGGSPLGLAKEVIRQSLTHLRPVDTFDLVAFESGTYRLFGSPRPANAGNLGQALRFVDGMSAQGGTEMGNAVAAALSDDVAKGRHRYVMFLTDGNIGFEVELFAAARELVEAIGKRGQQARVFAVGIGSSPNEHLIAGLARAGRGVALRASDRETCDRVVGKFIRYVDHPIVDALTVDPGSLVIDGQHPANLGALFASHATLAMGRYRGAPNTPPAVVGTMAGAAVRIDVEVVDAGEGRDVLGALWAKSAVTDLESAMWIDPTGNSKQKIIELGLTHHIVTPFTSFVAVDRSRVVGNGDPRLVLEPTNGPQDMEGPGGMLSAATEIRRIRVRSAGVVRAAGLSLSAPELQIIGVAESEARGRMSFGKLIGTDKASRRRVKRVLRAVRRRAAYCYTESSVFKGSGRFALDLVLTWSADGSVAVELASGGQPQFERDAGCIRGELAKAKWPALGAGTTLRVQLQFAGLR